jgi:hypothetical protein
MVCKTQILSYVDFYRAGGADMRAPM